MSAGEEERGCLGGVACLHSLCLSARAIVLKYIWGGGGGVDDAQQENVLP